MSFLAVGNPFIDRTLHVEKAPSDLKKGVVTGDSKEKVEELWQEMKGNSGRSLGGSGTNVIKALSCLIKCFIDNPKTALLGMVGPDKKEEIEKRLEAYGVKSLLAEGKEENGFVSCYITPDCERTMHAFFGTSGELSKEHIQPLHFEKVSHVHLEGYLAYSNVLEHCANLANGATISLDLSCVNVVEAFKDRLKDCADKVDIIFGNLKEMQKFTGCAKEDSILKKFKKEQIVVITDGSKGGWYKAKDSYECHPFHAIAVEILCDTTGAGDFFIAGFLAGFLGKNDIKLGIKVACFAASHVIQQDGTDLPEHKWEEMKQLIQK